MAIFWEARRKIYRQDGVAAYEYRFLNPMKQSDRCMDGFHVGFVWRTTCRRSHALVFPTVKATQPLFQREKSGFQALWGIPSGQFKQIFHIDFSVQSAYYGFDVPASTKERLS